MTKEERNYVENMWNGSYEGREWSRKVKERKEWKLRMRGQAEYEYEAGQYQYEAGEGEYEESMTHNLAI
jgi:hypothetical protein